MAESFKATVGKFLGLNECRGTDECALSGESPNMVNLKVTPDYTLSLRDGWEAVTKMSGVGRGLYISDAIYSVVSDTVYIRDGEGDRAIGTLESSEGEVFITEFSGKVYFLDSVKIKVWDGESFGDIEPYVPLVIINSTSDGAGVLFEDVNLLTGQKKQSFSPDGTGRVYKLAESEIDSVDRIMNGETRVSKQRYTVDLDSGTITFDFVPAAGEGTLVVTYTKGEGDPSAIYRMRYAVPYGGANDTRIFLWGDRESPSVLRYSGVYDGVSGFEYFPELYVNIIGTGRAITSVVRHYDSLMIFTDREAYECSGETATDAVGLEYSIFPVRTLSSEVGCTAENFVKLADNFPISLTPTGLYRWSSSDIRDERNAEDIGGRIKKGLSESTNDFKSYDRAVENELWMWHGDTVYIYNYALGVFYRYEGFSAAEFATDSEGVTWFLTVDGALCRFTEDKLDGGEPIPFRWESGYGEFLGLEEKNIHNIELELHPESRTVFKLIWVAERASGSYDRLEIDFRSADFGDWCFDDMSFYTAATPVRIKKRIKTKRARGFKVIITDSSEKTQLRLLSIAASGRRTER